MIVVVGTAGAGTTRQDAAFAVTALSDEEIARAAPASTADILKQRLTKMLNVWFHCLLLNLAWLLATPVI